jgi:hypothetical protein
MGYFLGKVLHVFAVVSGNFSDLAVLFSLSQFSYWIRKGALSSRRRRGVCGPVMPLAHEVGQIAYGFLSPIGSKHLAASIW